VQVFAPQAKKDRWGKAHGILTGERWEAYSELLFLRARYYAPEIGRFMTRDVWPGDYSKPMSYNSWLYAYANPVNLRDPSGRDPNCRLAPKECAYERMIEIIRETEPDRAEALIRLFEDDELFETWGNVTGKTCHKRLKWVLRATASGGPFPLHFIAEFEGDCGFVEGLQDDRFYRKVWDPDAPPSNQVGHFLTAVDMTYNHWALGFVIGHEQYHDLDFFRNNFSYLWVSTEDIDRWHAAVKYDKQRLPGKRDDDVSGHAF
jgi:RHS repeat-associated protein